MICINKYTLIVLQVCGDEDELINYRDDYIWICMNNILDCIVKEGKNSELRSITLYISGVCYIAKQQEAVLKMMQQLTQIMSPQRKMRNVTLQPIVLVPPESSMNTLNFYFDNVCYDIDNKCLTISNSYPDKQ